MNTRRVGMAILLFHMLAGRTQAAELYSPVLPLDIGDAIRCTVLNVGSIDRTLRADVVPAGRSSGDVIVPPSGYAEADAAYLDCVAGCFCRFTVDGSKSAVRAAGTLFNGATGTKVVVPAE